MLGILHDAVVFLIEQLSGAKHCHNYKFRFHKPEEAKEPPVNPHGSARAEVHLRSVADSALIKPKHLLQRSFSGLGVRLSVERQ